MDAYMFFVLLVSEHVSPLDPNLNIPEAAFGQKSTDETLARETGTGW